MPCIRDESTVEALAIAFTSNGRNQEQAMIDIEYAPAYAKSYCGKMWDNPRLIAAIAKIDAKTSEKLEITREKQNERLKEAFDLAKKINKPSAMVSAIREQNEMAGLHREKALNPEKEAEKVAAMSEEQKRLARAAELVRIDQEARKGIKLVKGA